MNPLSRVQLHLWAIMAKYSNCPMGSIWEVKYEYEYMYEYYPSVIVCPDQGKLVIGDKKLNVQALAKGKSSGGQFLTIRGKSSRRKPIS